MSRGLEQRLNQTPESQELAWLSNVVTTEGKKLLQVVDDALALPDIQLMAITGLPGVGKTTALNHITNRAEREFDRQVTHTLFDHIWTIGRQLEVYGPFNNDWTPAMRQHISYVLIKNIQDSSFLANPENPATIQRVASDFAAFQELANTSPARMVEFAKQVSQSLSQRTLALWEAPVFGQRNMGTSAVHWLELADTALADEEGRRKTMGFVILADESLTLHVMTMREIAHQIQGDPEKIDRFTTLLYELDIATRDLALPPDINRIIHAKMMRTAPRHIMTVLNAELKEAAYNWQAGEDPKLLQKDLRWFSKRMPWSMRVNRKWAKDAVVQAAYIRHTALTQLGFTTDNFHICWNERIPGYVDLTT